MAWAAYIYLIIFASILSDRVLMLGKRGALDGWDDSSGPAAYSPGVPHAPKRQRIASHQLSPATLSELHTWDPRYPAHNSLEGTLPVFLAEDRVAELGMEWHNGTVDSYPVCVCIPAHMLS